MGRGVCVGPVEKGPGEVDERAGEPQRGADPPRGDVRSRRDWNVLSELARGDNAHVGFQGLKRRLELHPEALRRSLARLIGSGEVSKVDGGGYRLTESGHGLIAGATTASAHRPPLPVAAFLLPSGLTPDGLAQRFAGRWFDGLYWYALEPNGAETCLKWLTPDDAVVGLRVGMGVVRVEVAGHERPDARVRAAAPLVAAVAGWLRTPDAHAAS